MTIAVMLKVNDGIVLASDSATTLTMTQVDGHTEVANIYNNANKVFNLHKGLPVGAMTWGLGNIGPASIATLSKDLRVEFQSGSASGSPAALDVSAYTMDEVVDRARKFMYEARYRDAVESVYRPVREDEQPPGLGFLVAGYAAGSNSPAVHVLEMSPGEPNQFTEVLPGDTGAAWWGQPEAIARILNGMSLATPQALLNLDIGLDAAGAVGLTADLRNQLAPQIVQPAMPIQDAIDLAEFLVHLTIQFVRFSPGHPTVGGPIEIATITKHEGFRWVRRKHFFDARLNPS